MGNKDQEEEKFDISVVKEQQGFDEKETVVQKIFWVLMTIFLIAGAAGAFGDGVLSKRQIEGTGFAIKYEKFARLETPTTLEIIVKHPKENIASIAIDNEYLKNIKIEKVIPQPESVIAQKDQTIFNIKTTENGLILFYLQPEHSGAYTLGINILEEAKKLTQFVYL